MLFYVLLVRAFVYESTKIAFLSARHSISQGTQQTLPKILKLSISINRNIDNLSDTKENDIARSHNLSILRIAFTPNKP